MISRLYLLSLNLWIMINITKYLDVKRDNLSSYNVNYVNKRRIQGVEGCSLEIISFGLTVYSKRKGFPCLLYFNK